MLGKYVVLFGLSATVVSAGFLQQAPGDFTPRAVTLVAAEFFDSPDDPDVVSILKSALADFDRESSAEAARRVVQAFSDLEGHLGSLRQKAERCAGGPRAELEIRRIELERERDRQIQRFLDAGERTSLNGNDEQTIYGAQFAMSVRTPPR